MAEMARNDTAAIRRGMYCSWTATLGSSSTCSSTSGFFEVVAMSCYARTTVQSTPYPLRQSKERASTNSLGPSKTISGLVGSKVATLTVLLAPQWKISFSIIKHSSRRSLFLPAKSKTRSGARKVYDTLASSHSSRDPRSSPIPRMCVSTPQRRPPRSLPWRRLQRGRASPHCGSVAAPFPSATTAAGRPAHWLTHHGVLPVDHAGCAIQTFD